MKKLFLMLIFMLNFIYSIDAFGQNRIHLYLDDGTTIEIVVGDQLKLSWANHGVSIKSTLFDWEYSLPEHSKISFNAKENDIESVSSDQQCSISFQSNQIIFKGFRPSTVSTVYTLSGQKYNSYVTDANGSLIVDVDDYPAGSYVFTINGYSYKFIKK